MSETTLPTTPTRELLDRDAVLNIIPTNWCDSLLTGLKAVLPQGNTYGYSPKHIEKLLLAIKAQIEALPHSTLTTENARLAERVRVLEGELRGLPSLMRSSIILMKHAAEIAERHGYLPEMRRWNAHILDIERARSALSQKDGE